MSGENEEFALGFTDSKPAASTESDDSLSNKKKTGGSSNGVKKKKKKKGAGEGSNQSEKKASSGDTATKSPVKSPSKSPKKKKEFPSATQPGAVAVAGMPPSNGESKPLGGRTSTSLSPKKKKKAANAPTPGAARVAGNGDVDPLPFSGKKESVVSVDGSIDAEDLVREISQQQGSLEERMGARKQPPQQHATPSKGRRTSKPATVPGAVASAPSPQEPSSPQPGAVPVASKAPKGKSRRSTTGPKASTSKVPKQEERNRSLSPKPGAHSVSGMAENMSPAVARKLAVSMNVAESTRGLSPDSRGRNSAASSRTSTTITSPRRSNGGPSIRRAPDQQAKRLDDEVDDANEDDVAAREATVTPGAVRVGSLKLASAAPLMSESTTSAAVNGGDIENQLDTKRLESAPAATAQSPGGTIYKKPNDLSAEKNKEFEFGVLDSDDRFTPIAKPISAKRVSETSDELVSAQIVTATPDSGAWWLRNRKIQILIAMLIVGLIVALVVAFTVKKNPSTPIVGPTSAPQDSYYQVGDNLDGDPTSQFGLSINMNKDGTRVAIADHEKVQVFELQEVPGSDGNNTTLTQVRLAPPIQHDDDALTDSPATSLPFRSPIITELSDDGNFVAVGWPLYDHNDAETNTVMIDAGLVQVYRLVPSQTGESEGSWEQVGNSLIGLEPEGFFGASISLSEDGGIVAIGAPGTAGSGGYAQVYYLNTGVWEARGSLVSGKELDLSVYSVSLSGDGSSIALGGIPTIEDGAVAKVFKWFAGDWTEQGTGFARTTGNTSYLAEISADGSIVVVSNYFVTDSESNTGEGLDVRAFRWMENLDNWQQIGGNMHEGYTAEKSGYFITLSRDGKRIGMGDPGRRVGSGAATGHAHIFEFDGNDWVQLGENISGEAAGDQFGYSVSISGNGRRLAVSAPYNRGSGLERGRVQIYEVADDAIDTAAV